MSEAHFSCFLHLKCSGKSVYLLFLLLFMELQHPKYSRITINPEVCSGKPCIRGMRFPVATLLGYLAAGMSEEQLLQEFPFLEHEDVLQAIAFAAASMDNTYLPFEPARNARA
jgi:uncharacterized protein (DUF433 family)